MCGMGSRAGADALRHVRAGGPGGRGEGAGVRRGRCQGEGHRRAHRGRRPDVAAVAAGDAGRRNADGRRQPRADRQGRYRHRRHHRRRGGTAAGESRRCRRQQPAAANAGDRGRRLQARVAGRRGAARGREGNAEQRRRGCVAGDRRRLREGVRSGDQEPADADAGVDPADERGPGDPPRRHSRARAERRRRDPDAAAGRARKEGREIRRGGRGSARRSAGVRCRRSSGAWPPATSPPASSAASRSARSCCWRRWGWRSPTG